MHDPYNVKEILLSVKCLLIDQIFNTHKSSSVCVCVCVCNAHILSGFILQAYHKAMFPVPRLPPKRFPGKSSNVYEKGRDAYKNVVGKPEGKAVN
jgi:hypothetical protein